MLFSKLEYDYENIKVIYRNDIDFSMYDKKIIRNLYGKYF